MKSGSSQVHVVMSISVMENQEIGVITLFYERGKSKADYIRKESAHIAIPKDIGLSNLKRIFAEVFLSGQRGALFCESILELMESISVNVR